MYILSDQISLYFATSMSIMRAWPMRMCREIYFIIVVPVNLPLEKEIRKLHRKWAYIARNPSSDGYEW